MFSTEWDRPLLLEEHKKMEDASKKGIPYEEEELVCRTKVQVVKRILNLASLLMLLFLCGSLEWAITSWQLLFERYEALPVPCRHSACLPKVTIRMAIYFSAYSLANSFAILPFRHLRRQGKITLLLAILGGFFTSGMMLMGNSGYLVIDPYLPAFFCLGVAAAGLREAYYSAAFRTKSSGMLWAAGWMCEKTGAAMPMMLLTNFKSALGIDGPSFETLLALWTASFTILVIIAMLTLEPTKLSVPQQTSRYRMKAPLLFKQTLKGQVQSWVFMTLMFWSILIMLRLSLYPITAIEHYRANSSPSMHYSLDHTSFGLALGPSVFNTAIWYSSESSPLSSAVGLIGVLEWWWSKYARWLSLRAFSLGQVLVMPLRPAFESFLWEYCERMFGYQAFSLTWAIFQMILCSINSILLLVIVSMGWWSSVMFPLDVLIAVTSVLFFLFLRFIDH